MLVAESQRETILNPELSINYATARSILRVFQIVVGDKCPHECLITVRVTAATLKKAIWVMKASKADLQTRNNGRKNY